MNAFEILYERKKKIYKWQNHNEKADKQDILFWQVASLCTSEFIESHLRSAFIPSSFIISLCDGASVLTYLYHRSLYSLSVQEIMIVQVTWNSVFEFQCSSWICRFMRCKPAHLYFLFLSVLSNLRCFWPTPYIESKQLALLTVGCQVDQQRASKFEAIGFGSYWSLTLFLYGSSCLFHWRRKFIQSLTFHTLSPTKISITDPNNKLKVFELYFDGTTTDDNRLPRVKYLLVMTLFRFDTRVQVRKIQQTLNFMKILSN